MRESDDQDRGGQKQSQILQAQGNKQATILDAEAERQGAILRAEGQRAARFLEAQGQAKAIETVFAAIHSGDPDPQLLAYQYLQTAAADRQGRLEQDVDRPQRVQSRTGGPRQTAVGGGADSGAGRQRAGWLRPEPGAPRRRTDPIDTDGWFDSNLPPAAAAARGGDADDGHQRRPRCRVPSLAAAREDVEPTPQALRPPDSPPPSGGAGQYGAAPGGSGRDGEQPGYDGGQQPQQPPP
ncbi:MAG: hypothetical protein WKF78_00245 [Candidatus Limnocylindrales bacterium]